MRKALSVILAVILCICLCGCDSNHFKGDNVQEFSVGDIRFSIPEEAADDYNPAWAIWDKIQIFNVKDVGKITVVQVSRSDEEYAGFENNYNSFELLADDLDNVELISSINSKQLDKGVRHISSLDGTYCASVLGFSDDKVYSISLEASSDDNLEKNFNDFLDTVRIK